MAASDIRLFSPLALRSLSLRNRIAVSPMCMYSSRDGLAQPWHGVHLGSRAVGGAGLVLAEMSGVQAQGRISPEDMGIWSDLHVEPLAAIVAFAHAHGAAMGMQLGHAGRKASTRRPWDGGGPLAPADGGWPVIGPSPVAFDEGWPVPHEMDAGDIRRLVEDYAAAARRCRAAGFDTVEIHSAHGYLLHQFLSPLANRRLDAYGGDFRHRIRLLVEVVDAVRAEWPDDLPLLVRLSCTDWVAGGWRIEDSVALARVLKEHGVDMIDCSSGGVVPFRAPESPGYHAPFSERIRQEAAIATAVVGRIADAHQAEALLEGGKADLVMVGRASLLDPYLPLRWADALGVDMPWPAQYRRAR